MIHYFLDTFKSVVYQVICIFHDYSNGDDDVVDDDEDDDDDDNDNVNNDDNFSDKSNLLDLYVIIQVLTYLVSCCLFSLTFS